MDVTALVVAVLALLVAAVSAFYARHAAESARREADATVGAEHRANTPSLAIRINPSRDPTGPHAPYTVRNDGPQDLDSIRVLQPTPTPLDGVHYTLAPMGGDFAEEIDLGPLALGETKDFLLAVGFSERLPALRVRVVARRGGDEWPFSVALDPHR